MLLWSTTEHENGQAESPWEGQGPRGPGVGRRVGNQTHPGAARHPSKEGIFGAESRATSATIRK